MPTEIFRPKTQAQIYDSMRRYLIGESSSLNNFNEGSRLRTLLEAISMIVSQTHNDFFQALKKAIPVSVYEGFAFEKLPGVKSAGQLVFRRSTAAAQDYLIPIGTTILLNGVQFSTVAAGTILTGDTESAAISSQCSEFGDKGDIFSNAIDTLVGQGSFINQPEGVESCYNPSAFAGGKEEESEDERSERFRKYVSSLSRGTVNSILAACLSVAGVKSATAVEFYPDVGWVTIFVDDGTGVITPELKTEVEKVINGDPNDSQIYPGFRSAGIQFTIDSPTIHYISITLQIKIKTISPANDDELKTLSKNAIEGYVNALSLGENIIMTEIIKVIKIASAEIHDVVLISPTTNLEITSNEIPRTSSVNVSSIRVVE